jgi:hypothetical protein
LVARAEPSTPTRSGPWRATIACRRAATKAIASSQETRRQPSASRIIGSVMRSDAVTKSKA